MNRLREEMKVIPPVAWVVAVCLIVGAGMIFLVIMTRLGGGVNGAEWVPFVAGTFFTVFLFVYVLLVGYVYRDSRRRGMKPVLWTLLAIFIPNAIGIILYFILREPLLRPCFKCGASVQLAFPFCPVCGVALAQTCPACRSTVQPDWSHCARCGVSLRTG